MRNSMEYTFNKTSRKTVNHSSGIRTVASCTLSHQVLEALPLGIWTIANRLAEMTGTGGVGQEPPPMAQYHWELGDGWALENWTSER